MAVRRLHICPGVYFGWDILYGARVEWLGSYMETMNKNWRELGNEKEDLVLSLTSY